MPFPLILMLFIAFISMLILISHFTFKIGLKKGLAQNEEELASLKEKKQTEALNKQRQVLKGKISEQIAPFLPGFPFKASECRFLGSPIDLIVFEGMDEGSVSNVYLIDIKTGAARLTPLQQSIKQAVENKRLFWYTYRANSSQVESPRYSNHNPVNRQQEYYQRQNVYDDYSHFNEPAKKIPDNNENSYDEALELSKLIDEIEELKRQKDS